MITGPFSQHILQKCGESAGVACTSLVESVRPGLKNRERPVRAYLPTAVSW